MNYKNILGYILFFFLTFINIVYSEIEKPYNVLDRKKEYRLRIYFFMTYPSCTGCTENINTVLSGLKNEDDIEFGGFISGDNNNIDLKFFKDKYKWDFKLVNDIMGMYYQYYKINKANSLIVLDNNGNLVSRIEFTKNPYPEIEQILGKYPKLKHQQDVKIFDDKIIRNDDGEIIGDNYYTSLHSDKMKKSCLMGSSDSKLVIVDSNGIAQNIINLKTLFTFYNPAINEISWLFPDSIIVGKCSGIPFAEGGKSDVLFFVDIINNTFWEKKITQENEAISNSFVFGNNFNQNLIFSTQYYHNPKKKDIKTERPLIVTDTNGKIIKCFGYRPDIYSKLELNGLYRIFLAEGASYIFAYQTLGTKILKFDENMNIIDSIELKTPSNLRIPTTNYPKDEPREEFMKTLIALGNTFSFVFDFFLDKKSGRFVFFYENRDAPAGTTDLYSPLIKYSDYLTVYDTNGNLISEVKIPDRRVSIISLDNNKLTYLASIQNRLHIKTIIY